LQIKIGVPFYTIDTDNFPSGSSKGTQ